MKKWDNWFGMVLMVALVKHGFALVLYGKVWVRMVKQGYGFGMVLYGSVWVRQFENNGVQCTCFTMKK